MRGELRFRHTAWPIVAALVVAYMLSFLDRQVLALLIDDVRRDLRIGDVEISLLLGPAFGVFYAVLGMPFGWLADRMRRTWLIAAGLLVWTSATVAGGIAENAVQLAGTRMLVGVGEAALVPAAVSLIADRFTPERRALPLAIFTAGISLGAGLALIAGGGLVTVARNGIGVATIDAWLLARAPWRDVMVMAGLAGLPLAAAMLVFAEPARGRHDVAGERGVGLAEHLRARRGFFVPLFLATSLLYITSNAFGAWLPSLFVRAFHWNAPMVGATLGPVVLVSASVGTLVGGTVATMLVRHGRTDGAVVMMRTGTALVIVPAVLTPLAGATGWVLGGAALVYISLSLCFGVATAALVAATPASLRGRVVALYLLLGNLAGLGLGPPAVGWLVEHVLRDPTQVDVALAMVALPTTLPAAVLLAVARRRFVPSPDNG